MTISTQTSTASNRQPVRYQTIQHKRASAFQAWLRAQVGNYPDRSIAELHTQLLQLSTPQQIRQASKDGIFISYARCDEVFALNLSSDLRNSGLYPWLDVLDVSLDADWRSEVDGALAKSGLMIAVMSRSAMRSRELRSERVTFMNQGKIVIPTTYLEDLRAPELYIKPIDFRSSYARGLQSLLHLLRLAQINVDESKGHLAYV